MNKRGFAISIVLYSIVFLLVSILYMILGVLKTRYQVNDNLRDNVIEQLNANIDALVCIRLTGEMGNLSAGDAFKCDVNGDGIYDETMEKFYYISSYYNQVSKSFDSTKAVFIHSLNSNNKGVTNFNNPVSWSSDTVNNGPVNIDSNFTPGWLNVSLAANPRRIFVGYSSYSNEYNIYQYNNHVRLLTVEEYLEGCNPISKCDFLFDRTISEIGNGLWLENIAVPATNTIYIVNSNTKEVSTATSDSFYMARAVIEVSKNRIVY